MSHDILKSMEKQQSAPKYDAGFSGILRKITNFA